MELNLVIVLHKYFFLYAWLSIFVSIVFNNYFVMNCAECKKNQLTENGNTFTVFLISLFLKFELSTFECSSFTSANFRHV